MLSAVAACIAVLLLLPGQSQGNYSISLTGIKTHMAYTITPSGVKSNGFPTGNGYLEAQTVKQSYTFEGYEYVPGVGKTMLTRYTVTSGGNISAKYKDDNDKWHSFNTKYYHAMEVEPGSGVFAREHDVEIQSSETYHKFSSNAILHAFYFGTYLKTSGQRYDIASGIFDEFDVTFNISNVTIVPKDSNNSNLFELSHVNDVNNSVFTNNKTGFSLRGDMITIKNMRFSENEGSLDLTSNYPRSTYFMIESSKFSDNKDETALFTPHVAGDCFFDEGFIYDTEFTENNTGFHLYTNVTFIEGKIANNLFLGEEGIRGGGGYANRLTLTDVPVTGNGIQINNEKSAGAEGGGIYAGRGTFNRDTFEENLVKVTSSKGDAEAYGGAIAGRIITASSTSFTRNQVFAASAGAARFFAHGGAIRAWEEFTGSSVTFEKNTASAESTTGRQAFAMGGGVSVTEYTPYSSSVFTGKASLENVSFTDNHVNAQATQAAYAYGGGLVANPVKMNNVSFTQNTAKALAIRNENFRYPAVIAIGGGATYVKYEEDVSAGSIFEIIDWPILFLDNDTAQAAASDTLQMNTVTFEGNKAVAEMKAGPLYGGKVTSKDVVAALAGGWLLRTTGNSYAMSNITITNNTAEATSSGILTPCLWAKVGGAAISGGTGTISHLSVTGNKAYALFEYSASVTSDNSARASSAYGGGLYLEHTKPTVSNGVFISNNPASSEFKSYVDTYTYRVDCEAKGGGICTVLPWTTVSAS